MSDYDELAEGEAYYLHVELLSHTDKAYQVRQCYPTLAATSPVWVPKSQSSFHNDPHESSGEYFRVASWFARKYLEPHGWIWDSVDDARADLNRLLGDDE